MRIIGGKCGGLILKVPKGYDVRPTPDLVKQAIFNSLGERVKGAITLELFGGTGALSLECLSRGAQKAVCIELSRQHARVIMENFLKTGLSEEQFDLIVGDVYGLIPRFVERWDKFDLILADPPFGKKTKGERSVSDSQQLLDNVYLPQLLKPGGLFILGHAKRDVLEIPPQWDEIKVLKHGDSWVRFLRAIGST